ncbi:hypothetical protein Emag_004733 [Eimeria magna]
MLPVEGLALTSLQENHQHRAAVQYPHHDVFRTRLLTVNFGFKAILKTAATSSSNNSSSSSKSDNSKRDSSKHNSSNSNSSSKSSSSINCPLLCQWIVWDRL